MKLIYIAGPYRAQTTWGIAQNIHRAREAGALVASFGAYPVIPHSNTAHMDGVADDALWLGGTLELMRRCDGVVFCRGWMSSSGSVAEHNEAKRLNIATWNGFNEPVTVQRGQSPWGLDLLDKFERESLREWIEKVRP